MNTHPERLVSNKLYKQLNGRREVLTEVGLIDLLTDTELIEIKNVKKWKQGVGQLLIYGNCYPYHQKRLHLFGFVNTEMKRIILRHCEIHNIVVTWDSED